MAGLERTIFDLARLRAWQDRMAAAAETVADRVAAPSGGKLVETVGFGSNPGNLRLWSYAPAELPAAPALVVVLHGCGQDAAAIDRGAGWSTLADRLGFVVLCPEQSRSNNLQGCFNWFLAADTTRDGGEALSIRQMIERAVEDHGIDRARIFVTGLSAGGAMANAMLAVYPEVFAGGGIVAGLPYGYAHDVSGALREMKEGGDLSGQGWGDRVRAASPHAGPWPRVSIWHGSADPVVAPVNAVELASQWTDVHALPTAPSESGTLDGQGRERWRDAEGRVVVERVSVAGMGHGVPLRVGPGPYGCGEAGPFLLDVGISSTVRLAEFWGLSAERGRVARPASLRPERDRAKPSAAPGRAAWSDPVRATIERALRSAGLLKD